jgi:hypothetical protein
MGLETLAAPTVVYLSSMFAQAAVRRRAIEGQAVRGLSGHFGLAVVQIMVSRRYCH